MGDHDWRSINLKGDLLERRMKVEPNGAITFQNEQDDVPVLKDNQARLNRDRRSSSLWDGQGMVHVGRIPLWLIEKWQREGLDIYSGDPDVTYKILQRLNSIEWEKLRTAPGKL